MAMSYLEKLRDRLPYQPQKFLFGDQKLDSLEDVVQFITIFFILVADEEFLQDKSAKFDGDKSTREIIFCNDRTIDMAGWFMKNLINRMGQKIFDRLSPLFDQKFNMSDIVDILFCQGHQLLNYASKKKMRNDIETAELFKLAFKKNSRRKQKKILSQLPIALFDNYLIFSSNELLKAVAASEMFGCLEDRYRVEICETWWNHLVQFRLWWHWYKKSPIKNKLYRSKRAAITLLDRIIFSNGKLRMCFYKNDEKAVWYTVNSQTGEIFYKKKGAPSKQSCLHFSLEQPFLEISRVGCNSRTTSIVKKFFRNALCTTTCHERNFQNMRCLKHHLKVKINQCVGFFMDAIDTSSWNFAVGLSDNSRISWEIYRIYAIYGKDSTEVYRVKQFFYQFPSLAQIVPFNFLTRYVSSGKSLKKAIPYWSDQFRTQAMRQAKDRDKSHQRLMKTVIEQICEGPVTGIYYIDCMLTFFKIKSPFVKQPKAKEALIKFCVKKSFFDSFVISQLLDFVIKTGYTPNEQNSLKSVIKRYNQWADEQNRNWLLAKGPLFPDPWFVACWRYQEYSICYVSSCYELVKLAELQENCADDKGYLLDILSLNRQFYQLKENNKIIGTISVKNNRLLPNLGVCLGKGNSELDKRTTGIINHWFDEYRKQRLPCPQSTAVDLNETIKLKSKIVEMLYL